MAVRPPRRPPAEAAPRRYSVPEGAGPILRGRGREKTGGVGGGQGPRTPEASARREGALGTASRSRTRTPDLAGLRRGEGAAARAPTGKPRADPGRRGKAGRARPAGGGGGPGGVGVLAGGRGIDSSPCRGGSPEGQRSPKPEGAEAARESGGGARASGPEGLGEQAGAHGVAVRGGP